MERTRSYEHLFFDGAGLVPTPERLRKVLVVGAGVAGLQTARQLLKLGCQVLVLETNDEVGGVWIRNYIGFGLQVPWRMYQFPEFPWPKDLQPSSEYPTGQEVQEYVKAYCREYDLRRYIRFNCKLLRLRWCAASRQWDALYCDTLQEKFFKVTVDYTVICAGIYSQPYIPDYEGTDTYAGIQLHAKDFVDLSLARGRRVVIVGAGKTALDCVSSIVATNTATSVTLLYRQAHWPLPRRMLGTSVRRLLFNRAMTSMMPPYYTAAGAQVAVSKATTPLRKLFWKSMESLISRKFRITEHMRPRVHLPTDLFYGGQILDNTMDKLVRSEALLTIKGEINRFVRNGVILQDGNFVAADLVLYCTGYLKTYDYLEGEMRARLDLQKDGLYLYRNCLPYAVPHLAFIGSEVSTYNNILTHGLQALWLAHVLSGRIALPSPGGMAEDVRRQQRWRRSVMPAQRSRGSVLMLYMMQYHDQLLTDMGQRRKRKGFNIVAECFGAYTAEDYQDLLTHDDAVLAARNADAQLAAAEGLPPAVLAATAAGRAGVVPGARGGGGGGGTAPPQGTRSDQRGSAGSDISGISREAGSAAASGGGGGGGGRDANAGGAATAAAVLRTAAGHAVLEDRLFSGSNSRMATSVSVRSGSGQGYHTEETALGAAGSGPGPGPRTGSGQGYVTPPVGVTSAAPRLLAGSAHGSVAVVRPSTQRYSAMGAASASRIPRTDQNVTDPAVHGQAAAGPAAPAGAPPVWARTERQRASAHAISMRVSTDLSAARSAAGAAGGYLSAGAIMRRPATAGAVMYSSASRAVPRHSRADSSESDVRSRTRVVLAAAAAEAAVAEAQEGPTNVSGLGPHPARDALHIMSSEGSSSSRSYGAPADADAAAATAGAAAAAAAATQVCRAAPTERVSAAAAVAAAAASWRQSFSSRSMREGTSAGSTAGAAAAASAASPLGHPSPNSPSRLSRHTGPASPIPCPHSAHHLTHGSLKGSGETWPALQTCTSGVQTSQRSQPVRWNLLNSTIDEDAVAPRVVTGGSGGGVGGRTLRSHTASSDCVRSAPENAVASIAAASGAASRNLVGNGGPSGGGDDNDGDAAGRRKRCDAASSLRHELELSATRGVRPSRCGGDGPDGVAQHPPTTAVESPAPRGASGPRTVEPCLDCAGEAASSSRGDGDLGGGTAAATAAAAAATAAAGELRQPDEGGDADAGQSCLMAGGQGEGGGGGDGKGRTEGGAAGQNSRGDGSDVVVPVSLAVAMDTYRGAGSGGGADACASCTGPTGPIASNNDRSHRRRSCSPSHSSEDTERVPDAGGYSSSSSSDSSSSSSANATEASVLIIKAGGGGGGGGGNTARQNDASRVRSGSAAASSKIYPVLHDGLGDSDDGGGDGGGIMAIGSGPPPQPSTPQPQAVGTPVWLATSACETRGVLNGASDGVYGSPGSGTLSLSLWHATAAVAGHGRAPLGLGSRAPAGSCGGAAESRLSVLSRGRAGLIEELDSGEEREPDGESPAVVDLAEVGGRLETSVPEEVRPRDAAVLDAGAGPGVWNGGGGGGSAAAAMALLCRTRSSTHRSPPRLGASGGVGAGARDWLRTGSFARGTEGIATPCAARAEGGNVVVVGGGGTDVAAAAAAAAAASASVGWPVFPHTSSMGTYSTGSSGGHLLGSISLAGGIGVGGSAGGSSAAAPPLAGAMAPPPGPSEHVARQLSPSSGTPLAADNISGARAARTGTGGLVPALAAAPPQPPEAEPVGGRDPWTSTPAPGSAPLSPPEPPPKFPSELPSPFTSPKNYRACQ